MRPSCNSAKNNKIEPDDDETIVADNDALLDAIEEIWSNMSKTVTSMRQMDRQQKKAYAVVLEVRVQQLQLSMDKLNQ